MRKLLITLAVLLSGCKTAEVAVTHPATGLHFVARIESEPMAASAAETLVAETLPAPAALTP